MTMDLSSQFPVNLTEFYAIEALVGQGAFSTVWRARHRTSGQLRAVKKIDASLLSPREIANEIAIMRLLRHENMVRCYDVFIEAQYVNVVVDMFPGGDLVDGLNTHRRAFGRVPNAQLARLAKQMMSAVAHVHGLSIIHRDVKGENFLSDRPDIGDPDVKVALSDFGTALRIEKGEVVYSRVGTPAFWAPEIYAGGYSLAVDVWAVGVTTFILLTGALPYEGEAAICARSGPKGTTDLAMPYYLSESGADFLRQTMKKEASERPPAREVARHAWLTTKQPKDAPLVEDVHPPQEEVQIASRFSLLSCIFSVIGGLAVYGCSALGHCIGVESARDQSKEEGARYPSKTSKASTAGTGDYLMEVPDKDILEKQATDLTKQISVNLTMHQVSLSSIKQ